MKRKLLIILFLTFSALVQVFAQNRTVTGTVTAKDDGLPLMGVTVKVKGSTLGTQTNPAGKYTLSVPQGATLVFSFIGFETLQVPVTGPTINVILISSNNQLGEVVVTTSLGIKHQERDLGYSTATITPKELTATDVTNVANGLTAKVSGLAVYTLDAGVDPNVSIVLRGNRSLEGNNNALIVLDGIPIPNGTLSSINPNDVADITVLKGASSSALYGSEASNGAILITTKRGTTNGKPTIIYQNSVQAERVAFYPKLQTQFGTYGGEGGAYVDQLTGFSNYVPYENQQYGPPYNGAMVQLGAPIGSANGPVNMVKYSPYPTSPIEAFFQTGITEQNDISFQEGDAKNSFYMSAQSVYRTTVVPNDKNIKNAFSVRGHRTYGIFSVDYSAAYTKTSISTYNDATTNGIAGSFVTNAGANSLYSSILQLPAFYNIKQFQNPDGFYGNPNDFPDAYAINPYWVIDHSRRDISRDVLLSQLKLKVEPTKWLDASYQISDNFGINQERDIKQEVDFTPYAISDYWQAGNVPSGFKTGKSPGFVQDFYAYGDGNGESGSGPGYSRVQGDAVLDFHHNFLNDLSTSLIIGNSIRSQYSKVMVTSSNQLLLKDFYNINTVGGFPNAAEGSAVVNNIAYFGDLNIGWKHFINFEATLRNEQDSRLSKKERSFYYPSAKLSFIPTDAIPGLKDSKILNYAKLYGSFSRVGNIDINPYNIFNTYNVTNGFPYGSLGGLTAGTENFSPTLKPELTTEIEFGAELQFLNSRLSVNATYYDQHVKNQTVAITTSVATGYSTSLLNIGETESKGEELQVTGQILTQAQNKFGWTLGGNFSINDSKVISLLSGKSSLDLGNGQFAVVNQPFPLLEGTDFVRDPKGNVVVDPVTGYPSQAQTLTTFGRTTPKYNLGVNTSFTYKFVSLSAVAEYRGGDVLFNGLGGTMTFTGAGLETALAGRERFIYPGSVIQTSPGVYTPNTSVVVQNGNYGFWQQSVFSGTSSPFVTSGAFWKIREITLSFNLDQFVKNSKFIKGATFALTGRNLFLFVPKTNYWGDPELSNASPTSNLRGVNNDGQTPETRVYGGSVKLTF
ncbi:MAG: SusC/RagA family TonB-linked outer membrane protein [Sphingobacteriales bacterium]